MIAYLLASWMMSIVCVSHDMSESSSSQGAKVRFVNVKSRGRTIPGPLTWCPFTLTVVVLKGTELSICLYCVVVQVCCIKGRKEVHIVQ